MLWNHCHFIITIRIVSSPLDPTHIVRVAKQDFGSTSSPIKVEVNIKCQPEHTFHSREHRENQIVAGRNLTSDSAYNTTTFL